MKIKKHKLLIHYQNIESRNSTQVPTVSNSKIEIDVKITKDFKIITKIWKYLQLMWKLRSTKRGNDVSIHFTSSKVSKPEFSNLITKTTVQINNPQTYLINYLKQTWRKVEHPKTTSIINQFPTLRFPRSFPMVL